MRQCCSEDRLLAFEYARVHKRRATIVRFVFMFQSMKLRNINCIVRPSVAVLRCSLMNYTCMALANWKTVGVVALFYFSSTKLGGRKT